MPSWNRLSCKFFGSLRAQFAHQIIPEFHLDQFKDSLHVQEPRTQTVDHLDNSQVFKITKKPALLELLPAAIQLHLHLLQSQQLEQHLLIPLHNREEVEGDFTLLKSIK